jgi:hypothetical protein
MAPVTLPPPQFWHGRYGRDGRALTAPVPPRVLNRMDDAAEPMWEHVLGLHATTLTGAQAHSNLTVCLRTPMSTVCPAMGPVWNLHRVQQRTGLYTVPTRGFRGPQYQPLLLPLWGHG